MINNTHLDLLQGLIHSEEYPFFMNTYTELFQHIDMRKWSITFKIRNHLPAIFPKQIFHTNGGKAFKFSSGEYWYSRTDRKIQWGKEAILAALPSFCGNLNTRQISNQGSKFMAKIQKNKSSDTCHGSSLQEWQAFIEYVWCFWKKNRATALAKMSLMTYMHLKP